MRRATLTLSLPLLLVAGAVFGCRHHNADSDPSSPTELHGCDSGKSSHVVVGPAGLLSRLRRAAARSSNPPFFNRGEYDEESLVYIGRTDSVRGNFFDVVILETTWGAACHMTRRLLIFDSNGTYLGNYSSLDERPTGVRGSVLAFPFPVEEGNQIDLGHGIPTGEVLLGGQLHGFDPANGELLPNNAMNPSVLRVTPRARRSTRRAARPAGYRERWTH